jgi:hypothetical protein
MNFEKYKDDIAGFARHVLGFNLWPTQIKLLEDMYESSKNSNYYIIPAGVRSGRMEILEILAAFEEEEMKNEKLERAMTKLRGMRSNSILASQVTKEIGYMRKFLNTYPSLVDLINNHDIREEAPITDGMMQQIKAEAELKEELLVTLDKAGAKTDRTEKEVIHFLINNFQEPLKEGKALDQNLVQDCKTRGYLQLDEQDDAYLTAKGKRVLKAHNKPISGEMLSDPFPSTAKWIQGSIFSQHYYEQLMALTDMKNRPIFPGKILGRRHEVEVEVGVPTKEDTRTLLQKAHDLISGPRQETYGDPVENWGRTAAMMSEYLNHEITADQACVLMILVKVSRLSNGFHQDSLLDIAGYAGLADIVGNKPLEHEG